MLGFDIGFFLNPAIAGLRQFPVLNVSQLKITIPWPKKQEKLLESRFNFLFSRGRQPV